MWPLLLAVVTGTFNCSKQLTVITKGRFLVLDLDTPARVPNLRVTSNSSLFNSSVVITSQNPNYVIDGLSEWSLRFDTVDISSVSETSEQPSEVSHSYLIISVDVTVSGELVSFQSIHFYDVPDVCDAIIGKTVYQNAPIVDVVSMNNPVDVLVQSPRALAIVENNQVRLTLTPTTHDAPRGGLNFTSINNNIQNNDSKISIQVKTVTGVPIAQISEITLNEIVRNFDHCDYPPLMVLPYVQDYPGILSSRAFEVRPIEGRGPEDEMIVNYLNRVPLSSVHNIPINSNFNLYFIFSRANPDGILNTDISYSRVPPAIFTVDECSSIVSVADNDDNMVRLCLRPIDGDIVALNDTGIVKHVDFIPMQIDICRDPSHAHLRRLGHNRAVYVCAYEQRVRHSHLPRYSPTTVVYDTRITFMEISFSGINLSSVATIDEDSTTYHGIEIIALYPKGEENLMYYTYNGDLKCSNGVFKHVLVNGATLVTFSTIPISNTNLTLQSEVYLSVVECRVICSLNLYKSSAAPENTSDLQLEIASLALDIQSSYVVSSSAFRHYRVDSVSTVPSVRYTPSYAKDVFVMAVTVNTLDFLFRFVVVNTTNLLTVPFLQLGQTPIVSGVGPLVFVQDGATTYLFNLENLVIVEAASPSVTCHNTTSSASGPIIKHAYSIGGNAYYAKQYLSAMSTVFIIDTYTGADGYTVVYHDTVDRKQTFDTTCVFSKANLTTTTRYHALFPEAPAWCDTLNVSDIPLSPYLPGGSSTLQSNQVPSGDISLPGRETTTVMYFSSTRNHFCDGSSPLPLHEQMDETFFTSFTTRLPQSYLNCTLNEVQPMLGTPVSMLLLEMDVSTFYHGYPVCTVVNGQADPADLPFVSGVLELMSHLGRGFHGDITPVMLSCDYNRNYKSAQGNCTALSVCSASEYEAVAPTITTDRLCDTTRICILGQTYEITDATATSNRLCRRVIKTVPNSYITIGATLTSDNVFAPKTTSCECGDRYDSTANDDAPLGGSNNKSACVACPSGQTAFGSCTTPPCSQHSSAECVARSPPPPVDGKYSIYRNDSVDQLCDPRSYLRTCTVCFDQAQTPCTETEDTKCNALGSKDLPDDCSPNPCPPGTFASPNPTLGINQCLPFRQCPQGWIKQEGTCKQDRVCATVGSEHYIYQSILGSYIGVFIAVISRIILNSSSRISTANNNLF